MATNRVTGKRYIGVTSKGMHGRRSRHEENAVNGREGRFYDAIRKHGPNSFIWSVLCVRKGRAEAYRREFLYVDALKPEYNVAPGGFGGPNLLPQNRIPVICLEDGLVFESAGAAAAHYGCDHSSLCKAARGKARVAGNLHFIPAAVSLSIVERFSLINRLDADFALARRRVEKCKQRCRGIIDGLDVKGRSAAGPQKSSRPVICLNDGERYPSIGAAARHYDVDSGALSELLRGKRFRKTVGGLRFGFAESNN
jgi:hypothetical protein